MKEIAQTPAAAIWAAYCATLPPAAPQHNAPYIADSWGDNPALADELAALIVQGSKTATCSALWEYENETDGGTVPYVGLYTVVLDGAKRAVCVVETIEVTVQPFSAVDAAFAAEEGEDDRSLASWRREHERFFSRTLPRIGRSFSAEMPLVCERFRVVYRP